MLNFIRENSAYNCINYFSYMLDIAIFGFFDTTRPIITLQFMAVLYLPLALVMNNLDKEWIHTN
jgi:hypothetical protein